jgi:nucleotide-binding universal stress UspA family protein
MFLDEPRRILCPVDFSDYSAAALRTAGNLAVSLGAEVMVLHAQPMDAPVYFTPSQARALKAQLRQSRKAAERHMAGFADEYLPPHVPRSLRVVEDDPVHAILRAFKEFRAGFVVMGTHGRTGLPKIRLGSVMESVLVQLKAPLITVGPQVKNATGLGVPRRILCAVDYSSASRGALEHAVQLAEETQAEIMVAHAVAESMTADLLEQERKSLCDWVSPALRQRCSLSEIVRHGNPAEQIVTMAETLRASLIVLAAEPRTFLGSLFFGTTVERVIRHSPAPVLSVK